MRSQSVQAWFQALIGGLAVADREVLATTPSTADPLPWPTGLLTLWEAISGPKPETVIPWRDFEQQSPAAVLLVATPLLLPNVNRYSHRQTQIEQHAEDWGLTTATCLALGEYFRYLCGGLPLGGDPTDGSIPDWPEPRSVPAPDSALAPLHQLAQDSQGQVWLVLERSRQAGWSGPDRVLAAMLSLARGGTLPLALQQRYLGSGRLGDRWLNSSGDDLARLGRRMYGHWAGLGIDVLTSGETAYNG